MWMRGEPTVSVSCVQHSLEQEYFHNLLLLTCWGSDPQLKSDN